MSPKRFRVNTQVISIMDDMVLLSQNDAAERGVVITITEPELTLVDDCCLVLV